MEVVFLTYLNRSGSTFLASRLAQFESVCMGIEARFKDGWLRPGYTIRNIGELHEYLDELYTDVKFRSWNVDREQLLQALADAPYPLTFISLLTEALRLYCTSPDTRIFVHKCGGYYRYVNEIRKEMPGARFIFIHRDPRAVFNSQNRSLDSTTGKPMLDNVLHFAFGYLHTRRTLDSLADDEHFLEVRYEDLVINEEPTIEQVISFLDIPGANIDEFSSYFNEVPDNQKHLHANVAHGSPVTTRLEGWQKELEPAHILLLQDVLRHQLRAQGYEHYPVVAVKVSDLIKYLTLRLLYTYESTKRRLFKIEHHY